MKKFAYLFIAGVSFMALAGCTYKTQTPSPAEFPAEVVAPVAEEVVAPAAEEVAIPEPTPEPQPVQETITPPAPQATTPPAPTKVYVSIKNFSFAPAAVNIKVGTTVIWTNQDSAPHTATAQGGFDSGRLSQGESFSYTFTSVGTFDYICSIHPSMKGNITVSN